MTESGAPEASSPDTEVVVGAIMTGGASRRFGSDKALADAGGISVGRRVVDALRGGGCDPVVALGGTAGRELGIPTVDDRRPDSGPLVALGDALAWLGRGRLVVVPCDLPLLVATDIQRLLEAETGAPDRDVAVVAAVNGHPQPSVGVWPASWARRVRRATRDGNRAWHDALALGPWVSIELRSDALADADTVEELTQLIEKLPFQQ